MSCSFAPVPDDLLSAGHPDSGIESNERGQCADLTVVVISVYAIEPDTRFQQENIELDCEHNNSLNLTLEARTFSGKTQQRTPSSCVHAQTLTLCNLSG